VRKDRRVGSRAYTRENGIYYSQQTTNRFPSPSSKTHIRELENRIQSLEALLKEQKDIIEKLTASSISGSPPPPSFTTSVTSSDDFPPPSHSAIAPTQSFPSHPSPPSQNQNQKPRSLIARLCARQSSLSADDIGQLRFFGPTSSLHTAETTSSSFVEWGDFTTRDDNLNGDIPLELQSLLLDQYWKHQHTVLQVIHREAFLHDMQNNRCRYYSKALLYAILACAAKISDIPAVRSLAFSKEPGAEPYLYKKAMVLVDEELETSPGITTIQALQLLSVCHCAKGADTKGWMESGE
jgi:hypothetical protein